MPDDGAYRHGDFTQAYPLMRGSAPLFVALLTLGLGLDRIPPGGYVGIALISCGLFALVDWRRSRPILLLSGLAVGALLLLVGGLLPAAVVAGLALFVALVAGFSVLLVLRLLLLPFRLSVRWH